MTHGRIYGIIPARMQSSRLPRKMLLAETGKPLLQHTWEAASKAAALSEIIIATDSREIEDVARGFGARVEMTGEHASGSDRIAEVVRRSCQDADIIVNIQGDEPEVDPNVINRLATVLTDKPQFPMATLATPIASRSILDDRSNVKCVRS
ncbi:MAG: NTP transferase domain-containing protein, partial [Planctomycetaceae bacterium]|nr:NTP transferase domain-containing protein [Planctomycetaceae bacterium]